ncbi:thymidylate synthase [Ureibacillus sp. FSL K6-0165]|uniref:thymidylate synthase n=1 Tax=Ureibacillus sp. FSL K6-0165 TaxID=2954606 RepID=UPI0030F9DF52
MNVIFVLTSTGQELLQMVSHDVAGLLTAVKGEYVTFPFGSYKYDFHTLDHYLEGNEYRQELVIYLKEEDSRESMKQFVIDAE